MTNRKDEARRLLLKLRVEMMSLYTKSQSIANDKKSADNLSKIIKIIDNNIRSIENQIEKL